MTAAAGWRWAPDHLVVGAASLEQGAAWCEAALGVAPGPGGKHPLMGTHNRLLSIASPAFPRAYLEVIAIDPDAAPPGRARWFDLDDAAVRDHLSRGPRLLHWVARCDELDAATASLRSAAADAGRVLAASRETPAGTLRWRIAVRDDGRRPGGAVPTPIEWGAVHPADAMPACGVTLEALTVRDWPAGLPLPAGVQRDATLAAPWAVRLRTPAGGVEWSGAA